MIARKNTICVIFIESNKKEYITSKWIQHNRHAAEFSALILTWNRRQILKCYNTLPPLCHMTLLTEPASKRLRVRCGIAFI